MRASLLFCILLLIPGLDLAAQGDSSVAPGKRVRLSAPSLSEDLLIGTVLSRGTDTLLVQVPDTTTPVAIPFAAIQHLDISRGRRDHMLTGFEIGFLLGAATGGVAYAACQGFLCPDQKSVGEGAALAVVTGLFLGLPGVVIGALIRAEDWERVPLPRLSVGAGPSGRGVTVGLAVRF